MESRFPGNAARLILIGMLVFIALSGTSPSVMPLSAARSGVGRGGRLWPAAFPVGSMPAAGRDPAECAGDHPRRVVRRRTYTLHRERGSRPARLGRRENIPAKLLDADTAGKAYYFADAQADGAREAVSRFGTIIYADERQLLVAAPDENEPELLDALPGQGIGLSLLSPNAIVAITKSAFTTLLPLISAGRPPPDRRAAHWTCAADTTTAGRIPGPHANHHESPS